MADGSAPILNVTGERVALGPLRRDLIPTYHRWMNDFETDRTQGDLSVPRTLERIEKWYERRIGATDMANFTIYALDGGEPRPIGITWLADIDYRHRTAGFGISIGEALERGKGYGSEATRLVLDFAFTALGLHNVELEVYSNNEAGIRAYQKAGFREYGRRHECYRLDGQVYDDIMMECLATGFESPVLGKVFVPDAPRERGADSERRVSGMSSRETGRVS